MPRSHGRTRFVRPAAKSARSAHAVWLGIDAPRPASSGLVVALAASRPSRRRRSGGGSSQRTARWMYSWRGSAPIAREPAQHRPGAVDVVHAPAAVPGAVVPLRAADEVERALGAARIQAVAQRAEQLEAAAGQVLGGRIEQRAVIGERDVVQVEAVVVGVERAPSRRPGSACPGTTRAPAPWPAACGRRPGPGRSRAPSGPWRCRRDRGRRDCRTGTPSHPAARAAA